MEDFEHGVVLTLGAAGGYLLRSDGTWEAFTPAPDGAR